MVRFRGYIIQLSHLSDICDALSYTQKVCQLRFTQSALRLVAASEQSDIQIWSQIKTDSLFSRLTVQSAQKIQGNDGSDEDIIYVQVGVEELCKTLHSLRATMNGYGTAGSLTSFHVAGASGTGTSAGSDGHEVYIHLIKQAGRSYLSLSTTQYSLVGLQQTTKISHDILVNLLTADEAKNEEPLAARCDLYLDIRKSEWSTLRRVTDQYRGLAKSVTLSANRHNKMELNISGSDVDVVTAFDNMLHTTAPDDDTDYSSDLRVYSVTVDIKYWWNAMQLFRLNPSRAIVGIADGSVLILYAILGSDQDHERVTCYINGKEDD